MLAILGVAVVACVALGVVCRLIYKRVIDRFDKMSPEERFRYQNTMRKAELL